MRSDRSDPPRGGGPAERAAAVRERQWFLAAAVVEAGWLTLLAWMALAA